jgi:hypothetical protein
MSAVAALTEYLSVTDWRQEGEGWALLSSVLYLGMGEGSMPAPRTGVLFEFPTNLRGD